MRRGLKARKVKSDHRVKKAIRVDRRDLRAKPAHRVHRVKRATKAKSDHRVKRAIPAIREDHKDLRDRRAPSDLRVPLASVA